MRRPATKSKAARSGMSSAAAVYPRFPAWLSAALLALLTLALYWPATRHDFVDYDDRLYVLDNTHLTSGLTLENVKWDFGHPVASNWHPLTMLSHAADVQLFGLKPWGHHLTNVLLHAFNTALVFLLLYSLTGSMWRSVLVAALFGWHPLHVESVAWVAERKDVLSGFFGLLALIFYVRYARRRLKVENRRPAFDYGLTLLFLTLGLLSKPMLVTWPFVMMLLDYWPLGRFKSGQVWGLVVEKIPFFTLTVAASVVTFEVQKHGGAVVAVRNMPMDARCGNALISYCRYLGKLFWPTDLSVFYPRPLGWPVAEVLVAGGLLLGISWVVFVRRRQSPWLLMGWLWFVGTLVPVIGLVQVGEQSIADRYAYLPSLGVLIMVVWGACELTRRWQHQFMALSAGGCAAIVFCMGLTWRQLGYWQDTETLFRHALAVTENNPIAHKVLASALFNKGQTEEAIDQYQEAIRLAPDYADTHYNLGIALFKQGRIDEAIHQYQEALRLKPDNAEAHNNLGNALARKDQTDEAIREFQAALRFKPDDAEAHNNLGHALLNKGQIDDAMFQFQEILRFKPDDADACISLGVAFARKGQIDEAIHQFQEAVHFKPDYAQAHFNLGVALLEKGQTNEAIRQYQEALHFKPDYAQARFNLGHVFLKSGQTDEAINQYQEAIRLEPDDADAHNNLGNAFARKGQIDEAIQQFQEAIRLKPDDADARSNLARALKLKNAPVSR